MPYSLLGRFQGGLLGSKIAERQAWQRLSSTQPKAQQSLLSNWSEIQRCATESLIDCSCLDVANWCKRLQLVRPSLLALEGTASASETAIAIFPIALYFHDRQESLHRQVREAAGLWLHPREDATEVLAWADAIAWIVKETRAGDRLLDGRLETLEARSTPLFKHLEQLRILRDRALPLESVLDLSGSNRSLPSLTPLALAFYCFASTPEDFELCVKRAARAPSAPQVATLTGALAGLYNCLCGIPPRWRANLQDARANQQQAQQLFAAWSGAYRPHRRFARGPAIAAAGALQPRASLKIISRSPG
ncbi:MAG: ADP-ribosylglycohydrolase family protein [Cyanobacteriota bacterium]|nr:ADP-ribosylglycohydrolase family protein [Cyanobacteriota bacterium]